MARRKSKKISSKKEKNGEKSLHEELISQMVVLSTSGFGLVAALAWNEAIQSFVKEYISKFFPDSLIWSKFVYALIITFFAVFVTYNLSKLASKIHQTIKR